MKRRNRHTWSPAVKPALVAVLVVALLPLGGVGLAAPGDGAAKKSVFLDMGAAPAEEIAQRVQRICAQHRDPARDDYIQNVVLVGVVDQKGRLRIPQLRAVLPHVPGGGSQECFDNVFVGPASPPVQELPWKARPDYPAHVEGWCGDSPYCGGILTPSWRWDNLEANRKAARLFLAYVDYAYPGVRANLHWYVTYEGYIDWFGDNAYSESVRASYSAYLLEMVRTYHRALIDSGEPAATASRAVLWSPTYENQYVYHSAGELETIRLNLRTMFHEVQALAAAEGIARGVDWLDMQDKIGQTGCYSAECYLGVKHWYDFLASVPAEEFVFASLRVNMELFKPGGEGEPDPAEQAARQDFYESQGIPLGASWELRWLPSPPA